MKVFRAEYIFKPAWLQNLWIQKERPVLIATQPPMRAYELLEGHDLVSVGIVSTVDEYVGRIVERVRPEETPFRV